MNRETRAEFRNRKRKVEFDTSRTYNPLSPKQRRVRTPTFNMNGNNSNPREGQITDLSSTIISNRPSTSTNLPIETRFRSNSCNSAMSEEITPEVRNLVADEALSVQKTLQEQIRSMVQDEMKEIRKSIEDLMKVVGDLSKIVSRNNQPKEPANVMSNTTMEPRVTEYSTINPPSVESNAIPGTSQVYTGQALSDNNQNRTPMSIPAIPTGTVYNNFVPRENGNTNQFSQPTGIQFIGNYGENIAGNLPTGYHFGDYNVPNVSSIPNVSVQRELPKMWIRIDKWGLIFDGNNSRMSVEDFIFRIERLQAQYAIPVEELERDFHLLLSGPAKDWYWLFVQTHFGVKWPGLKQALLSQYQTSRSNFEIMRDLVEKRQNNNESIDQFFQAMNQIRAKLVQAIPEYDMIKILKRNVKESVARIVYPISVSSVEQLRIECNEAERNFPRRDSRYLQPQARLSRPVSEVYLDHTEYANVEEDISEDLEVSALQVNQQKQKSNLICWNCKVPGHVFMECPSIERTLFCYRCGKPNVITPNCPNCQGNTKRGVGITGDLRPSKNPSKET